MRRIALIVGLTLVVSVVAASTGNLTIAVGQVGSILPATLTPTGTTQNGGRVSGGKGHGPRG